MAEAEAVLGKSVFEAQGKVPAMFPTPRSSDADHGGPKQRDTRGNPGLAMAARLFPSPSTRDHHAQGAGMNQEARSASLATCVQKLWPTPAARDGDQRGAQNPAKRKAGGHSVGLDDAVHGKTFPTPGARDWRSGTGRQDNGHTPQLPEVIGGSLNPDFVAWLMGWPRGWDSLEPLAEAAFEEDPWRDGEWEGVPRVAKGVPDRVNRLRMLGNGWVPQCTAVIGRRIIGLLGSATQG